MPALRFSRLSAGACGITEAETGGAGDDRRRASSAQCRPFPFLPRSRVKV